MAARLSIIVPTHDGIGLDTLFASVKDQLLPDDEIVLIIDSHEQLPPIIVLPSYRMRVLSHDAGHHCWGHCQINYGITQARGDYLMFIDDDDCIPAGALDSIRRAIAEQVEPRPLMFKFYSCKLGRELPPGHYVRESAIGGHCFIVPNIPDRLGKWECRYAGDYNFIVSTLSLYPNGANDIIWRDEIISIAG